MKECLRSDKDGTPFQGARARCHSCELVKLCWVWTTGFFFLMATPSSTALHAAGRRDASPLVCRWLHCESI